MGRYLFILLICIPQCLICQKIPAYDLKQANDCSYSRYLTVNNNKIFLPKGTRFQILKFLGWEYGMYDGYWNFETSSKDTISYAVVANYFFGKSGFVKDSMTHDSVFKEDPIYWIDTNQLNNEPFIKPGFKKVNYLYNFTFTAGNYYQVLTAYEPYTDTIIIPGDPLFGNMALGMTPIGKPFYFGKYDFKKVHFGCFADPTQYGEFTDSRSGESLKFSNNLNTIYYKSKNQKNWTLLYVYDVNPGSVKVSFFKDHHDNGYYLWYSGKDWVLAGSKFLDPKNGYDPQFFKKLH